MARGGARPGAGRPPGSKKARSERIAKEVSSAGAPPPDAKAFADAEQFLMSVINDPSVPREDKLRAAQAVIPFQKPKLADKPAGKKQEAADRAASATGGANPFAPRPAPKLAIDNTK